MTETLAEAPFATTDGPQRHASYAALAATAPVHRITLPTGQPAWLITGYNEARHALHNPRLVKSEVTAANTGRGLLPGEVYAAMGSHMLNRNPPDHTRLRRLVATAFTRRRVDQLTPRIQQITNELLDAMVIDAELDLIDSFALPLPITVICELLGVPDSDRANFRAWTQAVLSTGAAAADSATAAMEMPDTSLRSWPTNGPIRPTTCCPR
jgi:cytochrome P450